jgi:hypothetical protein
MDRYWTGIKQWNTDLFWNNWSVSVVDNKIIFLQYLMHFSCKLGGVPSWFCMKQLKRNYSRRWENISRPNISRRGFNEKRKKKLGKKNEHSMAHLLYLWTDLSWIYLMSSLWKPACFMTVKDLINKKRQALRFSEQILRSPWDCVQSLGNCRAIFLKNNTITVNWHKLHL